MLRRCPERFKDGISGYVIRVKNFMVSDMMNLAQHGSAMSRQQTNEQAEVFTKMFVQAEGQAPVRMSRIKDVFDQPLRQVYAHVSVYVLLAKLVLW